MTAPVEFGIATSNSYPSGTGSYSYRGSFDIIVQNLAFQKQVSIWAQVGAVWKDIPAVYSHSLPDNLELWEAPASNSESQFVAKYSVNGTSYWDNHYGMNYIFPVVFDEFSVIAGDNYRVVLGNANLTSPNLFITIGVQNLAYHKGVGIVFTTDHWGTFHSAYGNYSHTMNGGLEVWEIAAVVGSATEVEFAVFYQVNGNEYWDNNFSRNYQVTSAAPAIDTWG